MKQFNLHTKRYNFWAKWVTTCSLLIALPSNKSCHSTLSRSQSPVMAYIVQNEDEDRFKKEIANTRDISVGDQGRDWLYAAVKSGNIGKTKIVLARIDKDREYGPQYQKPSFPNASDPFTKLTPLGKAIQNKDREMVKTLIKNECIKADNVGKGLTALMLALQIESEEIAKLVLQECPSKEQRKLMITTLLDRKSLSTPLHLSIKHGFKGLVKVIADEIDTRDALCAKDKKQRTPLHKAVYVNKKEEFNILFTRLFALCRQENRNDYQQMVVSAFFEKDAKGQSVFARSYLSQCKHNVTVGENTAMFRHVLKTLHVRACLKEADIIAIFQEINRLRISKKISEQQAAGCHHVAGTIISPANNSSSQRTTEERREHRSDLPPPPPPPTLSPPPMGKNNGSSGSRILASTSF